MPSDDVVPVRLNNYQLYYYSTWHWGPKQVASLSSDFCFLTPTDYLKGRMRHWLDDRLAYPRADVISQSLDLQQEPSPNGIQPGQTTWLAYDGQPNSFDLQGTNSLPSLIASVLPDGTTWYKWLRYDNWGRVTNIVETWSTNYAATPFTRTNGYVYAADSPDLLQVIGPRGETLAGYAYDAQHQLLRATNALGDVTWYTYDSQGRLTSVTTPAGLITTDIYYATGDYTNFVQTTMDQDANTLQFLRTNSFTWANDLMATRTDERNLTTTFLTQGIEEILLTLIPYWPELPRNESACLERAIEYFDLSYRSNTSEQSLEQGLSLITLNVDLLTRLGNLNKAAEYVGQILKTGVNSRWDLQRRYNDAKRSGNLNPHDEKMLQRKIATISQLVEQGKLMRRRIAALLIERDREVIDKVIQTHSARPLIEQEEALKKAGCIDEVVELLKDLGQIKEPAKKSGFWAATADKIQQSHHLESVFDIPFMLNRLGREC